MKRATGVLIASLLLGGCTSYYKVSDPVSGRTYYTNELKKKGEGAVWLKDARTGSEVTIQNSEVQKISKEEFETNRAKSGTR